SHLFEVQSFYYHLRPYQDIDPVLLELLDQRVVRRFAADAVDVHARDLCLREDFFEVFFDPFRTEIALHKTMVAACRAGMHGRIEGTAIMTVELIRQLVEVQRDIAIPALRYPATDFAYLVRAIPAAVLEKDH